jgi:hypothetical protein
LLDFGGVIADGPDNPDWGTAMVAAIGEVLAEAGVAPGRDRRAACAARGSLAGGS